MTLRSPLLIADDAEVRVLTINRPESLNALSRELFAKLTEALDDAERAADVRAIVLTATGDRAFSSGADLKESARTPLVPGALDDTLEQLFEKRRKKPLIAAVNGLAYGGGLELVLLCDFAIAVEDAVFALPEASVGRFASAGGALRLPSLIGPARASRWTLTCETITAVLAERWGLVTEIVPREKLLSRAMELARLIASRPAESVHAVRLVHWTLRDERLPWTLNRELRFRVASARSPHTPPTPEH